MSTSKKRIKKIAAIKDSEIDYSDIPELNTKFWKSAKLVRPENKKSISLRVDSEVLSFFKKKGRGYQSLMNAVLKSYAQAFSK